MPGGDFLLSTEVILGGIVAGLLLLLAVVFLRRRTIARGRPLVLGATRPTGGGEWRVQLLRVDDERLELFHLGGISLRPWARLARRELVLGSAELMRDGHIPELAGQNVVVSVHAPGAADLELAVNREDYMALRSWLESAPPLLGNPDVI